MIRTLALTTSSLASIITLFAFVMSLPGLSVWDISPYTGKWTEIWWFDGTMHLAYLVRVDDDPSLDTFIEEQEKGWRQVMVEVQNPGVDLPSVKLLGFYWHEQDLGP